MNVLIIEPDKRLAANYRAAVQAAGFSARLAHSAQEAISMADEQTPDIIVVELQMKSHNGMEFMYELRSYHDWQHIPIVVQSFVPSIHFTTDETLLAKLGVREYLYKPEVTLEHLVKALRRTLEPLPV